MNNAGVLKVSPTTNQDGMVIRFAVNTVAPHVLTKELLPLLQKGGGRVIDVSSAGQAPVNLAQALPSNGKTKPARFDNDFDACSQSTLVVIMWTNALAATAVADNKNNNNHQIAFASLNQSSLIGTKMVKEGFGVEGKSLDIGADILVEATVSKSFGPTANGKCFDNDRCQFGTPHLGALNAAHNKAFVQAMDQWLVTHGYGGNSCDTNIN